MVIAHAVDKYSLAKQLDRLPIENFTNKLNNSKKKRASVATEVKI